MTLPAVSQQKTQRLDGKWWSSLYDQEQVEFLAGYIDCYGNDLGNKGTFVESWYTYAPRITAYYENHPEWQTRPVTSVLFAVRSKTPPKPLRGGEVWTEKHGFFDGDYWDGITDRQRVAFIRGYLACYQEFLKTRPTSFSKSPESYAEHISRWFGLKSSPSVLNPKRERAAIADALYKFADAHTR